MRALKELVPAAGGDLPAAFWGLWWGVLVNRFASFAVAFLGPYLVEARGLAVAPAGRMVALFGLGMALAGPLGGALADRLGRRATMAGGLIAGALAVGGLPFARGSLLLAGLAFLSGAASELYRPALNAAVADLVPPAHRVRAYGLLYWATNLSVAVGLLLCGLVAGRSFAALFLADAATSLACAAIVLWRVPETKPAALAGSAASGGLERALADGPFVAFLGLHLAALLVFGQWQLALPVDLAAHRHGPGTFARLMALNCAGVVLLQPVLGPGLARRDGSRLLAAMALLFGAGYGLYALGGGLVPYLLGTVLWTVGEVLGFPAASALVADLAPEALRGRYQGAFTMVAGLALALAPLLGGAIYGTFGATALWLGALALGSLAAAGHLLSRGPRRRRSGARRA
ncbi:MAG TPA: MFS transporter [Anaeromyxobacteraceae bacterium]|nr:MFS transporter [Anaeromyxobacteraceae bacterium]